MVINWLPLAEPPLCVTSDELLRHCRAETSELPQLQLQAAAMQDRIELLSGHILSQRELSATFRWGGALTWLLFPVNYVSALSWQTSAGDVVIPPEESYSVEDGGLIWVSGAEQPSLGDKVTIEIGAGHAEPPPGLKLGLLAAVAHAYDNRDAFNSKELDEFLARSVAPYRRHLLA